MATDGSRQPLGRWASAFPLIRSRPRLDDLRRQGIALASVLALGVVASPLAWANSRWGAVVYVNTPPGYALNSRWGPGTNFGIHTKNRRGCPLELSGVSRRGWLQLTNGTWVASNWVASVPRERIACITNPATQSVAIVATPPGYALNIRTGPGTGYARVGQYVHGARLPFTGRFNGSWTELTDGTWVDGSFLQFASGQGPSVRPTPIPTPTPTPIPTPDPYVQDLQRRLKQLGYLPPNFAINGIYDAETQAAVRTFQRVNGLPENGIVDAATWQAIYNATQPQPPRPESRQRRVNADDKDYAEARSGPGPEYSEVTRYRNGDIVTTTGRVVGNWSEIQGNMWIFTPWLQSL